MKRIYLSIAALFMLAACEPEVGSPEWCDMMDKKPKGDWTFQDTGDYAKHCLVK